MATSTRPGHPRTCGESYRRALTAADSAGPSPHLRGILDAAYSWPVSGRAIPAPAGNPTVNRWRRQDLPGHPRTCGESVWGATLQVRAGGPSPHLRGIPGAWHQGRHGRWAIPAPAGDPRPWSARRRIWPGHPRTCGESVARSYNKTGVAGPSPHLRGIRFDRHGIHLLPRAIPAPAGNPRCSSTRPSSGRGHPRTCWESM